MTTQLDIDLDVVVVSYNSGPTLGGALASLPAGLRVVVVDNASTDDSVEVARSHGAEVLENPVNAGFGAAANLGASRGGAELVLFLNPDATVGEQALVHLCRAMAEDPGLAIASPEVRYSGGGEQRAEWPYPSAAGAWREALGLHRLMGEPDGDGFVIGACFLVRRRVFEELGGFDARFWLYGEETDLCRRAAAAGWRVALVERAIVGHVGGASSEGIEQLTFEHFERGGEHNVLRHNGRAALVSYRFANLVGATLRSLAPGPPERRALHTARRRRLLHALTRHPVSVAMDSPAVASGEVLVVCSLEAWDDVWRRNQFLVRELLRRDPNRRVLFVEPPFDRVHEARRRTGRVRRRGLRPLDSDARIVRFEPVKLWPRVVGDAADRSLRRQVRRAAARLGVDRPVLWVNDPHYAGLARDSGWPAMYDITDDWTEAGDGDRATARVRRAERQLFAECGSVVVCSERLAASRRPARPDLVVVPNAVDAERFRRPRPRPADLPPSPVVVYVGTLHEDRLDVDLVCRLASTEPGLAVALVGPVALGAGSLERVERLPNVHLLGPRPYDDVPAYLQHAEAIVVPHVVTPFTESLDPIKAYECLAVGRPTVATPVAGFRGLGAPVRTAAGDAFVQEVRRALADGSSDRPSADVPSWTDRAAVFDGELRRIAGSPDEGQLPDAGSSRSTRR